MCQSRAEGGGRCGSYIRQSLERHVEQMHKAAKKGDRDAIAHHRVQALVAMAELEGRGDKTHTRDPDAARAHGAVSARVRRVGTAYGRAIGQVNDDVRAGLMSKEAGGIAQASLRDTMARQVERVVGPAPSPEQVMAGRAAAAQDEADRATADREQAARDREHASTDREQAKHDREALLDQLAIAQTDLLILRHTLNPT